MTAALTPPLPVSDEPGASSSPVRVLFCCDPGYFQHMAAALISLLEHNHTRAVEVHLIASRRDNALENRLATIIEGFPGTQLHIHDFAWAQNMRWHTSHHITRDAYLRLFAANVLPASIDRILYLDADLLVLADLGPLWEVELGDNALAAVPDPFGQGRREALGLPSQATYVNSGVLLLNLARWRSTAALERLSAYIEQEGDRLEYHDQDAINAVFAGEIKVVDYRWNVQARLWRLPRGEAPSDPEAVEHAMRNPAILHFTTLRKPWLWVMPTPHKDLYWQYLRRTPWCNATPADRRASKLFERAINYIFYVLRINYTWDRVLRRTTLGRILVRLQALARAAPT
jgi:lipopolysaccharide biosynthesis glycosyltransferase